MLKKQRALAALRKDRCNRQIVYNKKTSEPINLCFLPIKKELNLIKYV